MISDGLQGWRTLNGRLGLCVWLFSCEANLCLPIDCTSALACDAQRYCSCSCRLWYCISVNPLPQATLVRHRQEPAFSIGRRPSPHTLTLACSHI